MDKITEGLHVLTGIGQSYFYDEYEGCDVLGVIIQIDGKNYRAWEDALDSFRSIGRFVETDEAPKTLFAGQYVVAHTEEIRTVDEDGYPVERTVFSLHNIGGGLVLEVGTDSSDTYYPFAIFHWHPENLPINIEKFNTKNE